MSKNILLWYCSAILTLIVDRGQIQHIFRFFTHENIVPEKLCSHLILTLRHCMWGNFW